MKLLKTLDRVVGSIAAVGVLPLVAASNAVATATGIFSIIRDDKEAALVSEIATQFSKLFVWSMGATSKYGYIGACTCKESRLLAAKMGAELHAVMSQMPLADREQFFESVVVMATESMKNEKGIDQLTKDIVREVITRTGYGYRQMNRKIQKKPMANTLWNGFDVFVA